jgi:hypothetical protein
MDEVEVHTNPKVGAMWMRRGEQATVETPGDNGKRVLAGSLHWRTGRLVETWGGAGEGGGRPACSAATWTTCGGRSGTTGSST